MPDTYLQLGGYTFEGFGVPERVNGGGTHKLQVHKMLGGVRVIDALGADDDTISFRGRFRGAGAMDDAMFMDAMRRAGVAVTLSYWNQTATVIVAKFTFNYERFYEVPYELECVVVSNAAQQQTAPSPSIDNAVSSDLSSGAGTAAGDPACAAAFASLPSSYAANSPLQGAPASDTSAVGSAADSVQSSLGTIASTADVEQQPIGAAISGPNFGAGPVDPIIAGASLVSFAALMSSGATARLTSPFARRIALNIAASNVVVLQ